MSAIGNAQCAGVSTRAFDDAKEIPPVTEQLRRWASGDDEAFEEVIPLLYGELHRIAVRKLGSERRHHTLQPTALVNEAVAAMMRWRGHAFANRKHFLRAACLAMSRILVDYARRRRRSVQADSSAAEVLVAVEAADTVISGVAIGLALERLSCEDPFLGEVAGLRLFSDLTLEQIASATGRSVAAVYRRWVYARAVLSQELAR